MDYTSIPADEIISKTVDALTANGFVVSVVDSAQAAKEKAIALIPAGAQVMNMTSITLDTISMSKEILASGVYDSVRNKLTTMDKTTQGDEMRQLGAAPQWSVGSVHAVTQDGHVVIASNTGSQLPAYAYGAAHVVFIVGAQKIVGTIDEAFKRIYEHVLPLESERANKAYGVPGSEVRKVLIINSEGQPERISIIIVKEALGF